MKKSAALAIVLKEAGEDIKKLVAVATEAIAALANLETELETAEKMIDEQSKKLEDIVKGNPDYRPEVTTKKGTVRINHAIRDSSGKIISIEKISEDPKLIEDLLKTESSAVTLLTKK